MSNDYFELDIVPTSYGYECNFRCEEVARISLHIGPHRFMLCGKHAGNMGGALVGATLKAAFAGAMADDPQLRKVTTLVTSNANVVKLTDGTEPTRPGAWLVYGYGEGTQIEPIALDFDELEARRAADALGYHAEVIFWPSGAKWSEAGK
jgi:hypothetical protein